MSVEQAIKDGIEAINERDAHIAELEAENERFRKEMASLSDKYSDLYIRSRTGAVKVEDPAIKEFRRIFHTARFTTDIRYQPELIAAVLDEISSLSALEPAAPEGQQEPVAEAVPWTRESLQQTDVVWSMFYRDGRTLGDIAEHFGVSIYALSPWLTAPLTRHPEPVVDTEPWGYWVKHKYAEGGLVRTPCFVPEESHYTEVLPLFTRPAEQAVTEAKPFAFCVHDFHVARMPVKARGKFEEPTEYYYPASRENDARETARLMGATCTPLYAGKESA